MHDVLTGWTAETLGGLTLLALGLLWGWPRRRRNGTPAPPAGAGSVRTYTLLGVRAADGQPVHLPSSRPAGTVVSWDGPTGAEQFELTDGILADGTYAAEPLGRYL
ncbi:hypothetical protein ACWCQL_13170 [Streptomyces sp. NPDC002073]